MANISKQQSSILGLILLVVGIGLLVWAYQLSGAPTSQLSRALSGSVPDQVMYRYIGGGVCLVVGLYLLIKRGR
jgi:hypothetical protein